MTTDPPVVLVIGGPNGAGKSTIARDVMVGALNITEFVNADAIAQGLSGFDPERAAFRAGRVMLERLRELAARRESFGFESTLASRTFAPWLQGLVRSGYEIHVLYVWLRSPELAIRRVKARVRRGGHGIEPDVVRRRYERSARNFVRLYRPLADRAGLWRVYDNSGADLQLVAQGGRSLGSEPIILNRSKWSRFLEIGNAGEATSEDDH